MEQKDQHLREELARLEQRLADPAIFSNKDYPKLAKRRQELENIVRLFDERIDLLRQKEEAKAIGQQSGDHDLTDLANIELEELEDQLATNETDLRELLIIKDPNDDRDVVIEIRAAAGGDEASLFAADLYRMYLRWAERHNYKAELIDENPSEVGGFKEIIFEMKGRGAYSRLKYERGVHRVQRVPVTEASGRIHTSTANLRFNLHQLLPRKTIAPAFIGCVYFRTANRQPFITHFWFIDLAEVEP